MWKTGLLLSQTPFHHRYSTTVSIIPDIKHHVPLCQSTHPATSRYDQRRFFCPPTCFHAIQCLLAAQTTLPTALPTETTMTLPETENTLSCQNANYCNRMPHGSAKSASAFSLFCSTALINVGYGVSVPSARRMCASTICSPYT